jgi:hypothetical protein
VPTTVEHVPCVCGEQMDRELPNTNSPTEVRELVDPFTNVTWGKDHEAVMKQRKEDYFWEVEVPRLVEKYSTETCLENGWLIYNDKGELIINKPPKKR